MRIKTLFEGSVDGFFRYSQELPKVLTTCFTVVKIIIELMLNDLGDVRFHPIVFLVQSAEPTCCIGSVGVKSLFDNRLQGAMGFLGRAKFFPSRG